MMMLGHGGQEKDGYPCLERFYLVMMIRTHCELNKLFPVKPAAKPHKLFFKFEIGTRNRQHSNNTSCVCNEIILYAYHSISFAQTSTGSFCGYINLRFS